ncbi:MAG: tyrosine-type recombinase/integrase [Parcubacteria group bacterium]|nr:tyrosine-type recombinase/integrase [Parcubacteria group bacterium]
MQKPLAKYLSDFLLYLEVEKGLSSTSVKNYSRFLQSFFNWLKEEKLTSLSPQDLTVDHIRSYRLYLSRIKGKSRRAQSLKLSTQSYYLIALRAFLAFFHEHDIPSLPTEKIKLPKLSRERLIKFLTLPQLEKLLLSPDTKKLVGLRDRAVLETFFSTGLRVSELVALDRKDLEEPLKRPDVKDIELSVVGKGGHPRTIYFSQRAVFWLRKYFEMRKDDDDALFVHFRARGDRNDETQRLSLRGVEMIVKKYARMIGLPLVTPHVLRHTYATDLLSQGVDLRSIQEFLGHRNIATTQVYTHVTSKRLRDIHREFHSGRRLKNAA